MRDRIDTSKNIAARADVLMAENEGLDLLEAVKQASEDLALAEKVAERAAVLLQKSPFMSNSDAVRQALHEITGEVSP